MEEIKTWMAEIVKSKEERKSALYSLKSRYMAIIQGGNSKGWTVQRMHAEMKKATLKSRYRDIPMLKAAMSMAKAINEAQPKTEEGKIRALLKLPNFAIMGLAVGESVAEAIKSGKRLSYKGQNLTSSQIDSCLIYSRITKTKISKRLTHKINEAADKAEGEEKEAQWTETIKFNRHNNKVFYLCSRHNDCAEDHVPYQGKIYVDERWKELARGPYQAAQIQDYISSNGIKTIQWVTLKPAWLTTRPNCRHYFKALNTEEVINNQPEELIKRHRMDKAIGDRQYLQTISHPTNKEWYKDIRNAELVLEQYKRKLKDDLAMYAETRNPLIRDAIQKDRMMIWKWEHYIAERKK